MTEITHEYLRARRAELSTILKGDHVVLKSGFRHDKKLIVKPVVKVTPTQIVLPHDERFYRIDGQRVGRYMGAPSITGKATPKQIAAYERQQDEAQEKTRRAEQERQAALWHRRSLESLFPEAFTPSISPWAGDENDKLEVTFVLTEEQVRELAKRVSFSFPYKKGGTVSLGGQDDKG